MKNATHGNMTKQQLHETLRQLRRQRKDLTRVIRKEEAKIRRKTFQALFDQKQKLANAIINDKKGERVDLTTMRDSTTQEILYKPADVLAGTQKYFQELNKPPSGIKTQNYSPADAPRCYPWAASDALDSFELDL